MKQKKTKKAISCRFDEDIVDFFKGLFPRGYQTKMNEVLGSFVEFYRAQQDGAFA